MFFLRHNPSSFTSDLTFQEENIPCFQITEERERYPDGPLHQAWGGGGHPGARTLLVTES